MSSAWILGSCFLLFILCAIVYVLTIQVPQPELTQQNRTKTVNSSVDDLVADTGKHRISKSYQVVFSPRAFVDYPFGIRVVFAKPTTSKAMMWKPAERTEHGRSNVRRCFRASEYCGWSRSALQDPELTVIGGWIEFESEEAEPCIRVELKTFEESFQAITKSKERILKRDEETAFSLWLQPLESKISSLAIKVSHLEKAARAKRFGAGVNNCHELTTIALSVPVTFFPIALR